MIEMKIRQIGYKAVAVAVPLSVGVALAPFASHAATDFDNPATIAADIDTKIEGFINAVWPYVLDYIGWGLAAVGVGVLLGFMYRMLRKL